MPDRTSLGIYALKLFLVVNTQGLFDDALNLLLGHCQTTYSFKCHAVLVFCSLELLVELFLIHHNDGDGGVNDERKREDPKQDSNDE